MGETRNIKKGIKEYDSLEDIQISRRARLLRDIIVNINRNNYYRENRENTRDVSDIDKPFSYPDYIEVKRIDMPQFPMELLGRKDMDNGFVILQLHGGGYVGALKNSYRAFAGLYSEVSKGAKVLTIDYRVAPKNPYPAALIDAMCAYNWLIEAGYTEDKIILAGDSAGGGLAMAMCHKLKDDGRKLPLAIVAMSPWTDLSCSGASYSENDAIDPLFGNGQSGLVYNSSYISDKDDVTNPYISPMFGDFVGFPPMLIQVGTHEILLSDSLEVAKKAREAGVKVKYSEYPGMFHVFQMGMTMMPESKKAWSEIGKFLATVEGLEIGHENPKKVHER